MPERNTLVRSLHDLGAAAWFGGSLFGTLGLNAATRDISDERDRARVASAGWARWSPLNVAAVGAHLIGGAGLLLSNRKRAVYQEGVTANTALKLLATAGALGATAYSGVLGGKVAEHGRVHAVSGTEPSAATPPEVASAQKQLKALQWAIPVLTGAIIVLGAQQGEQQKPSNMAVDLAKGAGRRLKAVA
jgi:hypothetical protein